MTVVDGILRAKQVFKEETGEEILEMHVGILVFERLLGELNAKFVRVADNTTKYCWVDGTEIWP